MKAENNAIISGSAMAVLLGAVITLGCWFFPIGLGLKLFLTLIGIIIFILGLISSRG